MAWTSPGFQVAELDRRGVNDTVLRVGEFGPGRDALARHVLDQQVRLHVESLTRRGDVLLSRRP